MSKQRRHFLFELTADITCRRYGTKIGKFYIFIVNAILLTHIILSVRCLYRLFSHIIRLIISHLSHSIIL